VNLFQVLVNQVHVLFVQCDVDKTKDFYFFIVFCELLVVIVDVAFELGVEIAFDQGVVILL
jgi:hypothetical protein